MYLIQILFIKNIKIWKTKSCLMLTSCMDGLCLWLTLFLCCFTNSCANGYYSHSFLYMQHCNFTATCSVGVLIYIHCRCFYVENWYVVQHGFFCLQERTSCRKCLPSSGHYFIWWRRRAVSSTGVSLSSAVSWDSDSCWKTNRTSVL